MSNYKKVSIVILNHNGEKFLSNCLDSLSGLDYSKDKYEVVIIDNNSSDNSVEFIEKNYPKFKLIKNTKNMGFGESNNFAAKRVESEFIAFLNNDMRVEKDWLSRLISAIDVEKGIVCAGSLILNWEGSEIDFAGGNINFMGFGTQKSYKKSTSDTNLERCFIPFACGGSMLISREVFLDAGGFDEDYTFYNEDTDLGWRLWLYGYRVIFEPDSIAYHHHHGTGDIVLTQTHKRAFCDRNALFTMFKNLDDKNLGRFFPITLMLGILRIPAMTGIDTKKFFFNPELEINNLLENYNIRSHDLTWIAAVEDLTKDLPKLLEKREEIQGKRKITDEDLFSRFEGFFNSGYFGYKYWKEFSTIINSFNMDEFTNDTALKIKLNENAENEQIDMQKEHIKNLEK